VVALASREVEENRAVPLALRPLAWTENVVQFAVALLLLVIAGIVLYRTTSDLATASPLFPDGVTFAINGVLFVIIVMEILRTVVAFFEGAGFQLKPFLVIGIISAVRHILTIGARLTLVGESSGAAFEHSQVELGVEAGVVLALTVALLMLRGRAGEKTSRPGRAEI
jgi:uncharacterized membrane protein (DUF373 family)